MTDITVSQEKMHGLLVRVELTMQILGYNVEKLIEDEELGNPNDFLEKYFTQVERALSNLCSELGINYSEIEKEVYRMRWDPFGRWSE